MSGTTTLRVGLTGGIASGKSTVGRIMQELGCFVTDADRLVAELYEPDQPGAKAVLSLFGSQYLTTSGSVDKEKLSELVFQDAEARRTLEAQVHPLVAALFASKSQERSGLVVFEATLLVEGGGYRNFDRLVTVEADPALRLERAVQRGLAREAAEARMQAQASEQERCAVADFVIRNDGSLEDLRDATQATVLALEQELQQP